MTTAFQKTLCATVSALALVTAFAPSSQAAPLGMMMSSSSDNSAYVRSDEIFHKKIALVIESASPSHLADTKYTLMAAGPNKVLRYAKPSHYYKYAAQCQKEVNPNNTISAGQVTATLRQEFLDCVQKKEIIGVASAQPQSHSFSLNSSYLAQCQSDYGVKPGESLAHNFNQAQKTYDCVTAKQAQQDHGTSLAILATVVGGLGLLGVGFGAYESYSTRKYLQKSKGPSA